MLESIQFLENYGVTIGAVSLALLLGSLVVTLVVLLRLPTDFWLRFSRREREQDRFAIWWLRNIIAALLAVAGLAMLVLPGQGLLTLLVALIVSNFRWKNRIIFKLLKSQNLRRALNGIRKKFNKERFIFERD